MVVSTKSAGLAAPALAQTMSGGWPLFHSVTSVMMRAFSSGLVTSALMEWKRWVDGFLADD